MEKGRIIRSLSGYYDIETDKGKIRSKANCG